MENKEDKPKSGKGVWRGPDSGINRAGRPVGSKNKNTQEVREAFQNLVEMNLENMTTWLATIAAEDPHKAFKVMLDLSEFIIPKLARTELTGKDGDDLFKDMKFEFGPSIEKRLDSLDGIETIDLDD